MNEQYTTCLVKRLCIQPRSLDYITKRIHGVDPISTLEFLKKLEQQNILRLQDNLWLNEENAKKGITDFLSKDTQLYLKRYMGEFDFFKKPHPLDFEWRNTKNSVDYLTELTLHESQIGDDILILGMPTLFASFCRRDVSQNVTIVERNRGVIESLKELSFGSRKVIEEDVFKVDPEKIGTFATVVMDPPWYEKHFQQFIWLASRCLSVAGRLIISIPPINTRPGIDKQRIDWFKFCQEQGMCLESLIPGKLQYSMPFFEFNAARIAGAIPSPFWRKGDVAIFQKINATFVDRPAHIEDFSKWREVEINNMRIRVKIDGDAQDEMVIDPVVAGQILPTVSSRDSRREAANIWTSGNRVFKTNRPTAFYNCLRDYKDQIASNSDECDSVFQFISLISEFENEEYNQYLEWLYHEMEGES